MSQAINQVIPEGYKQTEVGLIPLGWKLKKFKEVTSAITCGVAATPIYVSEQLGKPFLSAQNVRNCKVDYNKHKYISKPLFNQITKNNKPAKGDILYTRVGAGIGEAGIIEDDYDFAIYVSLTLIKLLKSETNPQFITHLLNSDKYRFLAKNGQFAGGGVQNLNVDVVREFPISLPSIGEQTAIANALSDVDALLSELEKLIAKKQAIKTATMQQLLTGKTRLPQFAFYSDINSTEDTGEGKRNNTTTTIVNAGASDDGSLASQERRGMDSRRKGIKPSELGEIPEDWEVVGFGELFERLLSRKNLKDDTLTTFVGMQDVSENAQLVKQTPIMVRKVRSGFTYFEKGDVLVAKITPCFENGKGCHTKTLDTETGFGSTEFHVLRAKHQADSDFIYFWTTRDILRKDLEREMVGSAGHRRVPFLAIQNYKIPCPPTIEEQTAIATIFSDMDNEIQTLEQRLSKTRQIKQGMMQELLTGKTRLPFARLVGESDAD
jgi:type I restriction enzyme S subunit